MDQKPSHTHEHPAQAQGQTEKYNHEVSQTKPQEEVTDFSKIWDQFAEFYSAKIEPITTQLNTNWLEEVKLFLPSRPLRILELGCGSARFAAVYANSGLLIEKMQLFDISQNMLNYAAKNLSDSHTKVQFDLHISNDTNLDAIPDKSIDVVFAQLFFNVVPNPDHFIKLVRRVLRPDGVLSISVHNENTPHAYLNIISDAATRVNPEYGKKLLYKFPMGNDAQLKNLFGEHGFKVEAQKNFPFHLSPADRGLENMNKDLMCGNKLKGEDPLAIPKIWKEAEVMLEEERQKGIVRGFLTTFYVLKQKE